MSIFKIKAYPVSVRELNNSIILLLISILAIVTIDPLSLLSFIFFLLLTLLLGRVFFKGEEQYHLILLFCFYTILTIIIYWFQYIQFPQNGGSTGEGIFGGTDDLYFFQEATNGGISYRGDRSMDMHHYSVFLQFFNNLIHIYKIPNRLDLLFVNILAFTFIPIFTRKVAETIDFSVTSARLAFYFSAVCPIMIINGLVLVRDGWTAFLLIFSIYFVLKRKFLFVFLAVLLSFYLRIGSGAITLIFIAVLLLFIRGREIEFFNSKRKILYIVLLAVAVVVSITPIIYFLKTYGLYNTFYREGMSNYINSSGNIKSAAGFFYNLPAPLRISLGSLYYFGSPFLSFDGIIYNHSVTIRSLIYMTFPLLFVLYLTLFIQFISLLIRMDKTRIISLLFFTFLFSILLLSQLSVQIKHKTMLMPIFYLIVAFGYENRNRVSFLAAFSVAIVMFSLEVAYNFI